MCVFMCCLINKPISKASSSNCFNRLRTHTTLAVCAMDCGKCSFGCFAPNASSITCRRQPVFVVGVCLSSAKLTTTIYQRVIFNSHIKEV